MRATSILLAFALLAVTPLVQAGDPSGTTPPTGETASPTRVFAVPRDANVADYVIGAHDLLEISVFELDQLNRTVRVNTEGSITLPLLGKIQVGGLTPEQAEAQIARMLQDRHLVKNPQVTVFIKEFVSRRVSVQGAVNRGGLYPMLGQKTLLDMIGEAGGLSDRAGKKIYILRPYAPPGEERIEIDAEKLVYEADPMLNVPLQPGDIIMVPYQRKIRIYVNGAVQQPGVKEFFADEEVTLLQAVTAAGGTTDRANESRVQVIRRLPDGTKRMFKVNLKRIKRGRAEDLLLEPNDVVYVPESFF